MASVPGTKPSTARQDLYKRMDRHNTAPLWEVLHALIPNEPATRCKPYLWKYKDVRPYITEAGKLITAKEAIRRVLVLENPVMRSEGAATARFGNGLAPLNGQSPFGKTTPIFNYPYGRSRESLELLSKDQDPDPHHGWKMTFINPLTGGHAMPTIAAFIQLLPARFASQAYRSTDGTIYSVVEGGGRVTIGTESYEFEPRDVFVVPSWTPITLETTGETVLFSFSDRPGQEAMGLWREKRG